MKYILLVLIIMFFKCNSIEKGVVVAKNFKPQYNTTVVRYDVVLRIPVTIPVTRPAKYSMWIKCVDKDYDTLTKHFYFTKESYNSYNIGDSISF